MTNPNARTYEASAESTSIFGRVNAMIRHHTLAIDGPVQNGCRGEQPTPAELLLAAACACGTELTQVIARDEGINLESIRASASGVVDRDNQPHAMHTVFTDVTFHIVMKGPDAAQAAHLVESFQRRCPVYGSLAVASGSVTVHHSTE